MRRLSYAGLIVFALGVAAWFLAGFVDLLVVFDVLGRGPIGAAGVVGGIVLLPWVYGLAPLYAALTWGDWIPMILSFVGSSLLALLAALHDAGRSASIR